MKTLLLAVAASIVLFGEPAGSQTLKRRSFRILDLNISGAEVLDGQSGVITAYLKEWAERHRANVITLQEVCGTQHDAILAGLRELNPNWQGTWKYFGPMERCPRHGLSVFTIGSHTGPRTWFLDRKTDKGYRWWGLMRVHYKGVDIFNTHIRCASVDAHIPKVVWRAVQSPLFLLAGDFNTRPDQPWAQYLYGLPHWYEIDYDDREPTIGPGKSCPKPDGYAGARKIDYVWTNRLPANIWGDAVASPSNHGLLRGVIQHWFLE
jgi:hypothetical protein